MAFKPDSKGKIAGTNKNDKIVWEAAWNRAITVNAGAGDDKVDFRNSTYNNKLNGEAGNDKLWGGSGNDTINGGEGNDSLCGYGGNDNLVDTLGNNFLDGGSGNDKLTVLSGNNTLTGGSGDDTITLGTGIDIVVGGSGNDSIIGTTGTATINAGSGNDTINMKKSKGANTINGQSGKDTIYGGKGNDTINGNSKNDYIEGTAGNNLIDGGSGNDAIVGGTGNDRIYGRSGNDFILGNAGNNTINGGTGDDTIYGGSGNEQINAGADTNLICVSSNGGNDTIFSGGGSDTLMFLSENSLNTVYSSYEGNDAVLETLNGNKIYLKDYLNGGHSVTTVKAGNSTQSIGQFMVLYDIYNEESSVVINGTPVGDYIMTRGNYVEIHPDKGNDTIEIVAIDSDTKSAYNKFYINSGDGNNIIYGFENLSRSYMYSNALYRNFREYQYIIGEQSGDDLILKLTSNETLTIKDYFSLDVNDRLNKMRFMGSTGADELEDTSYWRGLLRFDLPNVTYLADNQTEYSIANSKSLVVAEGDNIYRSVEINSDYNYLWLDGEYSKHDHQVDTLNTGRFVQVNGNANKIYVNQAVTNDVYNQFVIDGSYNRVEINSNNPAQITINGGYNNFIKSYSRYTYVTTWNNTSPSNTNDIALYSDYGNKLVESNGADIISVYGKGNNVYCRSTSLARIYMRDSNAQIDALKGVANMSNGVGIEYLYNDNINVGFSYYLDNNAKNKNLEDYITLFAKDSNGKYTDAPIYIYGRWNAGSFNVDTEEFANKVKVRQGLGDWGNSKLNQMTQVIDMSNDNITSYTSAGESWKTYSLGDNILNIAKDVYIVGTEGNDEYGCSSVTTIGKQYTINDFGGSTDWLGLNQEANENQFRFFFDVDRNGKVVGKDLYIMSIEDAGNIRNSALYKYIVDNDSSVDYLKIENFFTDGKEIVNFGSGEIEYIEDAAGFTCDYEGFISEISSYIASWINNYNNNNGTDYNTVSEAIAAGSGTVILAQNYLAPSQAGDAAWSNYWG